MTLILLQAQILEFPCVKWTATPCVIEILGAQTHKLIKYRINLNQLDNCY